MGIESEDERNREQAAHEHRMDEEAEKQNRANRVLSEASVKGQVTGDYSGLHTAVGYSTSEFRSEPASSFRDRFYVHIAQLDGALQSADRLPPIWLSEWQFELKRIQIDQPETGVAQVRQMMEQLNAIAEHTRPRRQGIDLNVFARVEFEAQVLRIRDRLLQLETWLRVAAS